MIKSTTHDPLIASTPRGHVAPALRLCAARYASPAQLQPRHGSDGGG